MNTREKILEYYFDKVSSRINERMLAKEIKTSHTSVSIVSKELIKKKLLIVEKDSIQNKLGLNIENKEVIFYKRIHNLKRIYHSGLIEYLESIYEMPKSIVVFGSFSFGEDNEKSDIDLAIQTKLQKNVDLTQFEKKLNHKIDLFFLTENLPEELKKSIYNGVVLKGRIS